MQILEYRDITRGGQAKVRLVTHTFNVEHIFEIKVTSEGYMTAYEDRNAPGHPHINGEFICLDRDVTKLVITLCKKGEYKNAICLIAIALETINMRSAYVQRYTHLAECHICKEWKLKTAIKKCTRCQTVYCSDCATKCECGQGDIDLCKKCENSARAKCIFCIVEKKYPGKTVLRLNLEPKVESLILGNNIRTIEEMKNVVDGNTRIKGIGPAKLAIIQESYRANQERIEARGTGS